MNQLRYEPITLRTNYAINQLYGTFQTGGQLYGFVQTGGQLYGIVQACGGQKGGTPSQARGGHKRGGGGVTPARRQKQNTNRDNPKSEYQH